MRLTAVYIVALFICVSPTVAHSSTPTADEIKTISAQEYIDAWKDEAIYQMVLHKIPASITLAQGLLESGNGNSRLAVQGNNHFGIKCHNDWSGAKIFEDDETRGECFRKYDDPSESFEDHSIFLQKKRYEPLFQLDIKDYKGWAKTLKECGYATNPKYPQLLINLIEQYGLTQFDKEGLEHIKKNTIPKRSNGKSHSPSTSTDAKTNNSKPKSGGKSSEGKTITITNNREINLSDNRIKFIYAKAGDTPEKIAEDLDLVPWLVAKYNDLEPNATLKEGQLIYIQPKRARAKEATHTVQSGDSMWSISQKYGVKLKKLYKKNLMTPGTEPKAGQQIKLK